MSGALGRRFEAACGLATEMGLFARGLQTGPGRPVGTRKGLQDWLTEADGAVEAQLAGRLAALFPEDGFMGEEGGTRSEGGLRWIVDPIDGTSNFARGRKRWCVSIGLFEGDEPILGVLDAPALGEQFRALRGHGATLNGAPIAVAADAEFASAMVEFGWSPRAGNETYLAVARQLRELGVMNRAEGSGALGLADVACGRLDAYVEIHINLWDVAGALPLLREVGATIDHRGFPGPIVAATPSLGLDLARFEALGPDRNRAS